MAWQVESYRLYQMINQGNIGATLSLYKVGGTVGMTIYFTLDNTISAPRLDRTPPIAYMPYSTFSSTMQMLREEKPIYAELWTSGLGYVGTSSEPVGEDEGP